MPGYVLVFLSLAFMLFRVRPVAGGRVDGRLLRTISLNYRERAAMQRFNLCGLALILIPGAIGRWIAFPLELLAIVAANAILLVPVRYQITAQGIALNGSLFRRWNEFGSIQLGSQRMTLVGQPGNARFQIWTRAGSQTEVLALIRRYVHGPVKPAASPSSRKGGESGERFYLRRLLAGRS